MLTADVGLVISQIVTMAEGVGLAIITSLMMTADVGLVISQSLTFADGVGLTSSQ